MHDMCRDCTAMSATGRCGRRRMWQQPQHRDASALQPASSSHIWTVPVADAFQVSTGDWYYLCGPGRVGFPTTGRTVQLWTGTQLFLQPLFQIGRNLPCIWGLVCSSNPCVILDLCYLFQIGRIGHCFMKLGSSLFLQ
jgi:hypothetical protein